MGRDNSETGHCFDTDLSVFSSSLTDHNVVEMFSVMFVQLLTPGGHTVLQFYALEQKAGEKGPLLN